MADQTAASLEAGIVVRDTEALAAFYRAGLGFTDVSSMTFPQGAVHRLRNGDARVKLFAPSSPTAPRPDGSSWSAQLGFSYAALHVGDADAAAAAVVAAGGTILHPVTAHRPGARYALIADPDGNVWELLEESGESETQRENTSTPSVSDAVS